MFHFSQNPLSEDPRRRIFAPIPVVKKNAVWLTERPDGLTELSTDQVVIDCTEIDGLRIDTDLLVMLKGDWRRLHPSSRWRKGILCVQDAVELPDRFHALWVGERSEVPKREMACTLDAGYTIWHLLALELYDVGRVAHFVWSATKADPLMVKRDLWEYTDEAPELKTEVEKVPDRILWQLPDPVVQRLTSFKNPLELSLMTGRPLLQYAFDQGVIKPNELFPDLRELVQLSQWLVSKQTR